MTARASRRDHDRCPRPGRRRHLHAPARLEGGPSQAPGPLEHAPGPRQRRDRTELPPTPPERRIGLPPPLLRRPAAHEHLVDDHCVKPCPCRGLLSHVPAAGGRGPERAHRATANMARSGHLPQPGDIGPSGRCCSGVMPHITGSVRARAVRLRIAAGQQASREWKKVSTTASTCSGPATSPAPGTPRCCSTTPTTATGSWGRSLRPPRGRAPAQAAEGRRAHPPARRPSA